MDNNNIPLNFTISELLHSDTAKNNKINNTPDNTSLDNLLILIVKCLQPVRQILGKPMIISSGYRNALVNRLVGGSNTSEHTKGMAADFVVNGMSPAEIIKKIRQSGIKYTQLIEEYSGNTSWVHISYNKNNLKCETLRYKNGVYTKI